MIPLLVIWITQDRRMGTGVYSFLIRACISEILKMIRCMEMDCADGQMEGNIEGSFIEIRSVVMAS